MKEDIKYVPLENNGVTRLTVPKGCNVLIDDVEYFDTYAWRELNALLSPVIFVANATELTNSLSANLAQSGIDPDVIVFPAKGGLEVQKRLPPFSNALQFQVETWRNSSRDVPSVQLPEQFRALIIPAVINTICIIDDVIGSGGTVGKVAESINSAVIDANAKPLPENEWWRSRPEYPPASYRLPNICAAAWLYYQNAYDIAGRGRAVTPVIRAVEYIGSGGKPAINSLSTLIRPGTKEDGIRLSYARKYSQEPEELIRFFNSLGGNDNE